MAVNSQDPYEPDYVDSDVDETREWQQSLDELVSAHGRGRAREIMMSLIKRSKDLQLNVPMIPTTDYINTIATENEPAFPGDEELERKYRRWIRWNAAVLVHRAQRPGIEVGGHISTYASSAALYEVGFNHFFRGPNHPGGGDQIFMQGHASPGIYARSFLEGRLSSEELDGFRQEHSVPGGLPSYPHPRHMDNYWQFPTVSMGIGPMNAIYQAQANRYLHNHGIKDTSQQHVWAFLGDGEMDEPQSRGLLQVAANDQLDNLTFVINCNLQRLDGPVRGNTKIIQELESFFRGAGWNVIKVVWSREWDELLARDTDGALVKLMNDTPDGDFQTYKTEDGAYVRENFFGRDPRTLELVKDYSDDQVWALQRGGHDYRKVYAAYKSAMEHTGSPTVILAHTIKGYGLGPSFEGRNATHQMKKLTVDDLKTFRDHMRIPISDAQIEAEDHWAPPYYHPGNDAPEIRYMRERRAELGGYIPDRQNHPTHIDLPPKKAYGSVKKGSGKQKVATTMAFVRLLKDLLAQKGWEKRFVPIVPDEARTFGLDSFFPSKKIYNPHGQHYTSVDRELLLAYKESPQGLIYHVGINEDGAASAFTALGTSYSTQGEIMVPVYLFYSMFGFQRTGDVLWAATDARARGFLLGATAGRTTLTGEGLQHADGHSPILASTNPAVITYDPAYSYEIAHIVESGLDRMYGGTHPNPDVIYYLTVYNEPIQQPAEPEDVDVEGIVKGIHRVALAPRGEAQGQILASGVAVPWALQAQQILADDWNVNVDVWSVTSWNELRRDGVAAEEHNFLHPEETPKTAFVSERLRGAKGPIVAVTDFTKAVPDQIRQFVDQPFATLGADDFGFSDTRAAARRYFKIDAESIVVRMLQQLAEQGVVSRQAATEAITRYDLLNIPSPEIEAESAHE
ncbi:MULTISPECIES: pyruvate dehydrogenase (acetyl-transferring), homodimeric type [unclassified Pseudoclavibacter]|uniref:pyruvate dehydrogenase (acetyl-transferring), homodimeric type n=1 Tax=unclassified Pseudoclavibacter TaxID=2615177 RepID=UPI0013015EBC|nr:MULTISPECIES: pyruvate dehydrogenase (acetyl-transferring), homodimeric type [unclassified Pseudoclavibacter]KAB1658396.1 pyruvate dehydrogenase (acetyl-transferring), homodimeric type [Pseudoclavibacter sp. CFCC 11306]KAB1661691.1 pyruvate dehydrogenase (acetyl-transferring), homodimeric type [Pseudoclavibacter sp. CFCC 13796]